MTEQITEEKTIENNYMKLLQQDCEVFTDKVMEYPPSAISLGEKIFNTKKGDKESTYTNRNLWQYKFCTSTQ